MNFALVIGINHYREKPLTGAINDANEFAKWLVANGEVAQDKVWKLVSTSDNELVLDHHIDLAIVALLTEARKYKSEQNRLYFYFSGHGIGVTFSKTALCMRLWSSSLPNSCISSLDYHDGLVNQGIFDELVIFLDCCREYDYMTDPRKPAFLANMKIADRPVKVFVGYSTAYGKLSYEVVGDTPVSEDPNAKQGAFTQFLIESLSGDADQDNDSVIHALDLKKHLEANFKSFAARHNKIQGSDIHMAGEDFVLHKLNGTSHIQAGVNFTLTFKRNSEVELKDGAEGLVQSGQVTTGTVWELTLKKGMYRVIDKTSGEWKLLTNFNPNTLSKDEF